MEKNKDGKRGGEKQNMKGKIRKRKNKKMNI
jgi:hypothetical protein